MRLITEKLKMESIRNIAIIAHVDHGKTTLVDKIIHEAQILDERKEQKDLILDNNDLERERGITILSKNVSVTYKGIKGIRKDVKSNTFLVQKYIRGKRFSSTFTTLEQAADWKKNFHPSLNLKPLTSLKKDKLVKKLADLGSEFKHHDSIVIKNGNSVKDLKGKSVKLVELSVSHYLLSRALEQNGLKERDVNIMNTSDADIASVFMSEDNAAVVTWNPPLQVVQNMKGAVKVFTKGAISRNLAENVPIIKIIENIVDNRIMIPTIKNTIFKIFIDPIKNMNIKKNGRLCKYIITNENKLKKT